MKQLFCLLTAVVFSYRPACAQMHTSPDSLMHQGTLQDCVKYALAHQPSIQQSMLDEEIAEKVIHSKLADWYPQVNLNFGVQHYYQPPTSVVGGTPVNVSLANSSTGQFLLTQTIFDRDVLLASSTAQDVREQSRQRATSTTIDVVTNVSKAFYAVLLTEEQNQVLDEDILRLEQSLKDAYSQYQSGVVDKTDFERATVSLNNARAERRQNQELLSARCAILKEQMGYPSGAALQLEHDSTEMEQEIRIDTTQTVDYAKRVEYQLLKTQERLAEANLEYEQWSFLPSLTVFGEYALNYQNNQMPALYHRNYPSSSIGLQLSFPIFLGGKRVQEIEQAELELKRVDFDITSFENSANAEYTQTLANYKSNLNTYHVLRQNLELARDVYHVIQLQYKAGTKTYLEVISAETDLRTAELNQTNALYQVLSSKLDVQRALGIIQY